MKCFLIEHNESDNKGIEEKFVWNRIIMHLYIFLYCCFSREIEKTTGKYFISRWVALNNKRIQKFQCFSAVFHRLKRDVEDEAVYFSSYWFRPLFKTKRNKRFFYEKTESSIFLSCLLCDNVVLTCSPQQCLYSWYLCCLSGAGWGPFLHWEPVWFSSGAWMDPLFTANNCSRQVAKAFQQGQHASLNLGRGLSS